MSDLLDQLGEINPEALTADGFDDAYIGYDDRELRAVYSVRLCIDILVAQGMDYDEAVEYFEFNVSDAYLGPMTPIFLNDLVQTGLARQPSNREMIKCLISHSTSWALKPLKRIAAHFNSRAI